MPVLHRFRDITTFTVYVNLNASDLQKSFSFNETVKTVGHVRFSNHV